MDASLEILVPKGTTFSKFEFEIPYFEWDGVQYPQGPPETSFGNVFKLKFEDVYNMSNVHEVVPEMLKKIEWQVISISGDGLDHYNAELFGVGNEKPGFTLRDLFRDLLSGIDSWIVIFGPQFDGFHWSIRGRLDDILNELEHSLRRSRQGFLIYHC